MTSASLNKIFLKNKKPIKLNKKTTIVTAKIQSRESQDDCLWGFLFQYGKDWSPSNLARSHIVLLS